MTVKTESKKPNQSKNWQLLETFLPLRLQKVPNLVKIVDILLEDNVCACPIFHLLGFNNSIKANKLQIESLLKFVL